MKFNEHLENIEIYEAGKPIELVMRDFGIAESQILKMASNENPFGASPKVISAVQEKANSLPMYPDDSMFNLKQSLANKFQIKTDELIIGAGSDQIIEFISRAKLNPKSKILINKITFAMYSIYAKQMGAEIITTDSVHHDLEQFKNIFVESHPDLVYLCVPNNPTGDSLSRDEVYDFIDFVNNHESKINQKKTLIVVDGAYMEYAKFKDPARNIEPKELLNKYSESKNVVYLGTFSKAYGLGGMRVGYGISNNYIISNLYKMRPPFNVTTLSLVSAEVALTDTEFVNKSIKINFEEMEKFKLFATENNFEYIESYTNFITLLLSDELSQKFTSTEIANSLLEKGIIVRNLQGYNLNAIRVTIGKPEQNLKFFEVLKSIVK
jgi:histidinol-phosphate aminotransferase